MTRRLSIRKAAESDMAEAADWYDEHSKGLGRRFVIAVDQTFSTILERPHSFPAVEREIRRAIVPGFPYCVYFVIDGDVIAILGVLHASRNPTH